MQMILKNSEILRLIILSGHMMAFIQTNKAIFSNDIYKFRADSDKYADQQQVFEKVGL